MRRILDGNWLRKLRERPAAVPWMGALGGGVLLLCGGWWNSLWMFGLGAVSAVLSSLWIMGWRPRTQAPQPAPQSTPVVAAEPAARPAVAPEDANGLVEQMHAQGRYALLLRPQIVANLSPAHRDRTRDELTEHMAFVPAGEVELGPWDEYALDFVPDGERQTSLFNVDAYYLDRYPVTNRQFLEFVMAGAYEQMSLWDAKILPAVIDFVDATGCLGPRYWRHGRYLEGTEDHPVIGVSWYEAMAYCRWVGKRMATDAEWVKAACWPVPLSPATRMQRRYPWGDNMDRERANIWGSGPGRMVSVTEFGAGVSVGGVYQMIGNVWEWTASNFGAGGYSRPDLILPTPMKSLRGGAFDTYFDNQAACQFQSGENPVARRYNIGFRCALGACDVSFGEPGAENEEQNAASAASAAQTQEAAV